MVNIYAGTSKGCAGNSRPYAKKVRGLCVSRRNKVLKKSCRGPRP